MKGINLFEYIDYVYAGADYGPGEKYFDLIKDEFKLVQPPFKSSCICGHLIKNNCYIRHKTTNQIEVIGNCCIKKFIPEDQQRKTCSLCNKPHKNRNLNICNNCQENNPFGYVLPLGRYKGKKLIDIYDLDRSYFDWVEASFESTSVREFCKQIRATKPNDTGSSMAINENYIFTFGKYKGYMMKLIVDSDRKYVEWIADQFTGRTEIKELAKKLLDDTQTECIT